MFEVDDARGRVAEELNRHVIAVGTGEQRAERTQEVGMEVNEGHSAVRELALRTLADGAERSRMRPRQPLAVAGTRALEQVQLCWEEGKLCAHTTRMMQSARW